MKKKLFSFAIMMFFSYGLISTTIVNQIRGIFLVIACLCIVMLTFIEKRKMNVNKIRICIFTIISIVIFLLKLCSYVYNYNFDGFFSAISFLSLAVLFFEFIPRLSQIQGDIYKIVCLLCFISTVCSFYLYPIKFVGYKGIFYNPNSLGLLNAAFFTYFIATLPEKTGWLKIGRIAFLLLSAFNVVISSSRTAAVSIFCVATIWALLEIHKNLRKKINFKFIINLMILITVVSIFCAATDMKTMFKESIIAKFERHQSDIFNYRTVIWARTLNDISAFGYTSHYFTDYDKGKSGHNMFISMLGAEGVFVALSYVILIISFLRQSFIFYFNNRNDENRLLPLLSSICYSLCCFTESMGSSVCMFLMYYSMSIILSKRYRLV